VKRRAGSSGAALRQSKKLFSQDGIEGPKPSDYIRIDRLWRSGGGFTAKPQTEPAAQKSGESHFFDKPAPAHMFFTDMAAAH